jgi:hypothetical protein
MKAHAMALGRCMSFLFIGTQMFLGDFYEILI